MALEFDIIPVPTGISLGASIAQVLERGVTSGKLEILHGDTYIFGLPTDKTDIVSEGTSSDYYSWAEYETPPLVRFRFSMVYGRGNLPRRGRGRFSQVISVLRIRIFTELPSLHLTFTLSSLNTYSKMRPLQPVPTGRWLDFGHLDRYYKSEQTSPRNGPSIPWISRRSARKSSNDAFKMTAETDWFESLPRTVKTFTPQFLELIRTMVRPAMKLSISTCRL